MQFQFLILTLLLSFTAQASSESQVEEVFTKYDRVLEKHEFEHIDEIFTKKFLSDNGGKEEFIEKIKELPKVNFKSNVKPKFSWKPSLNDNEYLVNLKPKTQFKSTSSNPGSQFILKMEDQKLKIDGTSSDHE